MVFGRMASRSIQTQQLWLVRYASPAIRPITSANGISRQAAITQRVQTRCDDGLSKSLWLEFGWKQHRLPEEDLYDLIFDPGEHQNLVADPQYKGTLMEMRVRLDSWMRRTNDPILRGPVPAPPGAKVNDPDGTSPKEPTRTV